MNNRIRFKQGAAAFEEQFHCRLCLHDYTGRLPHDLLPPYHLNPFCTAWKRKRKDIERQCIAFDAGLVQERLSGEVEFLLKKCPCGLIEGVFPVRLSDRLAGCLFAGPFAASATAKAKYELLESPVSAGLQVRRFSEELPHLPRSLYLFRIYGEMLAGFIGLLAEEKRSVLPLGEREQIERLLEQKFHRNIGLTEAAELLNLSPPRASDRIHRIFGRGFCSLLRDYRLESARKLLALSCFPVEEIARRCGFRDGAYFHRIFRQETGMTPIAFRQLNRKRKV